MPGTKHTDAKLPIIVPSNTYLHAIPTQRDEMAQAWQQRSVAWYLSRMLYLGCLRTAFLVGGVLLALKPANGDSWVRVVHFGMTMTTVPSKK